MQTLQETAQRLNQRIESGIPTASEEPRYDCDTCQDIGYVPRGDAAMRQMVPCPDCSLRKKIAARVPERYRAARVEHFREAVADGVVRWLAKPTDGLLICGPVGTGKTYLAWAMLMSWWALRKRGDLWRAEQLYRKLRDCYTLHLTEASALEGVFAEPLLVLDDLGAGSLSDHERRLTLEVLNVRSDDMRPTVLTTNWNLAQISERMDDRIASRLSGFTRVELAGADRRTR